MIKNYIFHYKIIKVLNISRLKLIDMDKFRNLFSYAYIKIHFAFYY